MQHFICDKTMRNFLTHFSPSQTLTPAASAKLTIIYLSTYGHDFLFEVIYIICLVCSQFWLPESGFLSNKIAHPVHVNFTPSVLTHPDILDRRRVSGRWVQRPELPWPRPPPGRRQTSFRQPSRPRFRGRSRKLALSSPVLTTMAEDVPLFQGLDNSFFRVFFRRQYLLDHHKMFLKYLLKRVISYL